MLVRQALVWAIAIDFISGKIMGVEPENQKLYEPIIKANGQKKWKCLNSSIEIDWDQINDDYCDCPDGSDEPGTNACGTEVGTRMFYCENEGHFPGYIENFKLNDGVCDYDQCCDGSDEYMSELCPNKCQQVNQQYMEYRDLVMEEIQLASDVQKSLIKKAHKHKTDIQNTLDIMKLDYQKLSEKVPKLEQKLQKAIVKVKRSQVSVFDKISGFTETINQKLQALLNSYDSKSAQIKQLESMLMSLSENYNPNFNDASVKETVNGYRNYLSNKEEESFDEDILEDIKQLNDHSRTIQVGGTQQTPSLNGLIHYYIESIFLMFSEHDDDDDSIPVTSSDLESIDHEFRSAKKNLEDKETEIGLYETDLKANYGPNDILRAVAGDWINGKNGEYEYKIGILDTVYQDNTLLGKYETYEDGILKYTNGHKCWNGPKRSAHVELVCGAKSEILQINEPERCMYFFTVSTPIACRRLSEQEIRAKFKVDYQRL